LIGKPVALIQVPNQRLFSVQAAAQYLGCDRKTLKKRTAELKIVARNVDGRRMYTLEAMDAFIDSLPSWTDNPSGRESASAHQEDHV
jgi:hypothetical protein